MESFMNGFAHCAKKDPEPDMDLTKEMEDLLKIYKKESEEKERRLMLALSWIADCMRSFVECHDEHVVAKEKLQALVNKLVNKNEEDVGE